MTELYWLRLSSFSLLESLCVTRLIPVLITSLDMLYHRSHSLSYVMCLVTNITFQSLISTYILLRWTVNHRQLLHLQWWHSCLDIGIITLNIITEWNITTYHRWLSSIDAAIWNNDHHLHILQHFLILLHLVGSWSMIIVLLFIVLLFFIVLLSSFCCMVCSCALHHAVIALRFRSRCTVAVLADHQQPRETFRLLYMA